MLNLLLREVKLSKFTGCLSKLKMEIARGKDLQFIILETDSSLMLGMDSKVCLKMRQGKNLLHMFQQFLKIEDSIQNGQKSHKRLKKN
jgi:hypothetical protein